ncbi:MAG: hypothetical protein HWE10_15505 [Gammaproteobacteria bacterium]|nr:hypothetical protein [Gammaproteobacteria bacterium]
MKVFAHRGISALFPENSQSAISACNDQPFAGIEVDVFQVEQEFFIVHDRWLTRLFGINKHIDQMTADEMRNLNCKDGLPIPTLDWLFQQLSGSQFDINLELKKIADIQLLLTTLDELCETHRVSQQQILLSSFNHTYLNNIAELQSNYKLGMLLSAHPVNISNLLNDFPLYSVHVDIDCISADLINSIKQHQLKVFVFTVDHESELLWLKQHDVDAVFSNNPLQAYNFIK